MGTRDLVGGQWSVGYTFYMCEIGYIVVSGTLGQMYSTVHHNAHSLYCPYIKNSHR